MLALTSTEVVMRFSFRVVVSQPYSKGERPPALTLNRPCTFTIFLDILRVVPYNILAARKKALAKKLTGEIAPENIKRIFKKEPNRLDKAKAVSYNHFCAWELDLAVPATKVANDNYR